MAIQKDFVLVQRDLFDRMRQHCENCHDVNIPLQALPGGRFVIPTESTVTEATTGSQALSQPSGIEPSQSTSTTEVTGSQAQPSGTGPSSSDREQSHCGTRSSAQSRSHPKKREGKSRRAKALRRFIQNAPKANGWREKQSQLKLDTVEEYEHVIQGFLGRSHTVFTTKSSENPGELGSELVVVGRKLAILTKGSLDHMELQKSFSHFQILILLSYCEFLRQKGVSSEIIDELVQTATNKRKQDRNALLATIPWIHKLIVELVKRGWRIHRATELFFLSMLLNLATRR
jgi:hypothetical protein